MDIRNVDHIAWNNDMTFPVRVAADGVNYYLSESAMNRLAKFLETNTTVTSSDVESYKQGFRDGWKERGNV